MNLEPKHRRGEEDDDLEEVPRRSIFSEWWFRAVVGVVALVTVAVIAVPYLLDWWTPPPLPTPLFKAQIPPPPPPLPSAQAQKVEPQKTPPAQPTVTPEPAPPQIAAKPPQTQAEGIAAHPGPTQVRSSAQRGLLDPGRSFQGASPCSHPGRSAGRPELSGPAFFPRPSGGRQPRGLRGGCFTERGAREAFLKGVPSRGHWR